MMNVLFSFLLASISTAYAGTTPTEGSPYCHVSFGTTSEYLTIEPMYGEIYDQIGDYKFLGVLGLQPGDSFNISMTNVVTKKILTVSAALGSTGGISPEGFGMIQTDMEGVFIAISCGTKFSLELTPQGE